MKNYLEFEKEIKIISKYINTHIANTPESFTNISEWCKKEICWTKLKDIINNTDNLTLSDDFKENMITKEDLNYENREAKKEQKIDNEMELLKKLYKFTPQNWKYIIEWGQSNNQLTLEEIKFLNLIPLGKYPSDKQLKRIVQIINKLEDEGMSSIIN